jgi:hypothetical protein
MRLAIGVHKERVPRRYRDEFETDVLASCWHAWVGLARRGRDPVAIGPAGIVANAVRYVLAGRMLGTGKGGRDATDPKRGPLPRRKVWKTVDSNRLAETTIFASRCRPHQAIAKNGSTRGARIVPA